MDATKRPIKISPELVNYSEKHKVFEMMKNMLELLIIDRPAFPLQYLIDYLKKDIDDVPRIFVLGPPASGKFTISKVLAGRLQCIFLTPKEIFSPCNYDIKNVAEQCMGNNQPIPVEIWTKGLKTRIKMFDCEKKGFVVVGFPETREQAYSIQCEGIFPTHIVLMEAPDNVLIERAQGKRIDPHTGDVYHMAFDAPPSQEIKDRLIKPDSCSPDNVRNRLWAYKRNMALVEPLYSRDVVSKFNADQPLADVLQQVIDYCVTLPRVQAALRTPRIVLIGPPGSGKSTVASLICKKYGIQLINCTDLILQAVSDGNNHGLAMRSYVEKKIPVPDSVLIQLIESKLTDLCCSTYGWLLYRYPKTAKQAEELDCVKLEPNRVLILDVPPEVSLERLCERRLDPITGATYHISHNYPTDPTVENRMVIRPCDEVKMVKHRINKYNATIQDIKDYYTDHIVIDANQDLKNVFELVESYLVNPLPINLNKKDCQPFDNK